MKLEIESDNNHGLDTLGTIARLMGMKSNLVDEPKKMTCEEFENSSKWLYGDLFLFKDDRGLSAVSLLDGGSRYSVGTTPLAILRPEFDAEGLNSYVAACRPSIPDDFFFNSVKFKIIARA